MRRKQRGYTLVELGIGTALVLSGTAIALAFAANVQKSARTASMMDGVATVIASTRALRPNNDFYGVTIDELALANGVPSGWYVGGMVVGPWGGRIQVFPWAMHGSDGNAPNAFRIVLYGLEKDLCKAVVRRFDPLTRQVVSNATTISSTTLATSIVMTEATLEAGCSHASNQNTVHLHIDGGG
jgi:type II secretory pathway pseudopilin PulG